MPRGPRIDAPGLAHHVWHRGVGRMDVFRDDVDREEFLARFRKLLAEQCVRCFGVVLLSNHYHAALQTGHEPLWKLMHRLATGYAAYFNARHGHAGHLFQNRYGSRVLASDEELATVVVYLARNPLEARMVRDESALRQYRWSSYPALIDPRARSYGVAVAAALSLFGRSSADARAQLRARVARGVTWPTAAPDERLHAWPALSPQRASCFAAIAQEACARLEAEPREVRGRCRRAEVVGARADIASLAARAGFSGREIARELGVSESAASRLIRSRKSSRG